MNEEKCVVGVLIEEEIGEPLVDPYLDTPGISLVKSGNDIPLSLWLAGESVI